MKQYKIDIIVPIHNEEGCIKKFITQLIEVMKETSSDWKVTFIDDGSSDKSLSIIEELCKKFSFIHYIQFKRNFGHQAALKAGITNSTSDFIVMMDGDLQLNLPKNSGQFLGRFRTTTYH